MDPQTWYTIGIVAVRPRFMGKSSITVYLNGEVLFQSNLPFVHPRSRVARCVFGENLNGRLGPVIVANENFGPSTTGHIWMGWPLEIRIASCLWMQYSVA